MFIIQYQISSATRLHVYTILVRLLIVMGGKLSYPQVEMKDKVAIVTGGNSGIGYETTKALAMMGAHTIIACRSEERGQQVSLQFYVLYRCVCIDSIFSVWRIYS